MRGDVLGGDVVIDADEDAGKGRVLRGKAGWRGSLGGDAQLKAEDVFQGLELGARGGVA